MIIPKSANPIHFHICDFNSNIYTTVENGDQVIIKSKNGKQRQILISGLNQ